MIILINSSDNFEDCWPPFFELFSKYFESYSEYEFYLNTQKKRFNFNKFEVHKPNPDDLESNTPWSDCLIDALSRIDSEYILYFQEDYFLDKIVEIQYLDKFEKIMSKNSNIVRIGLTLNDYRGSLKPTEFEELWEAEKHTKYKVSTQASIWKKDAFLKYLKKNENGWMFEIFGSWRTYKYRKDRFLTLNRDFFEGKPVFSYIHTGIIKGKWNKQIPELFKKEGLLVDFDKRGFYDMPKNIHYSKIQVIKLLLNRPYLFIKGLVNLVYGLLP